MKYKILGNILFCLTIASIFLAFIISLQVGESYIFGAEAFMRYSWIMFFFIPVGILSIVLGIVLKRRGEKYKKNLIVAYIVIPLLFIFGMYRFIFTDVTYNKDEMLVIEEKIQLNLPEDVKLITSPMGTYKVTVAKLNDKDEKTSFEKEIQNDDRWQETLSTVIKNSLPWVEGQTLSDFDYFVFYNLTTDEYNVFPEEGEYSCMFIAYDKEIGKLKILNDFTINIVE